MGVTVAEGTGVGPEWPFVSHTRSRGRPMQGFAQGGGELRRGDGFGDEAVRSCLASSAAAPPRPVVGEGHDHELREPLRRREGGERGRDGGQELLAGATRTIGPGVARRQRRPTAWPKLSLGGAARGRRSPRFELACLPAYSAVLSLPGW